MPFCEFGGNMSVMGVKIEQFEFPVCNSFKAKIIRDQLCFQFDPNRYKDRIDLQGDLSNSLFIDYNENREDTDTDIEEYFITVNTIGNF